MKKRILIIEDDIAKIALLKQSFAPIVRKKIDEYLASTTKDLFQKTISFQPETIIFDYAGSAADLFYDFKAKGIDLRNTEIGLINTDKISGEVLKSLREHYHKLKTKSSSLPITC